MQKLTDVPPGRLQSWLGAGDAVLVDCREEYEHLEEWIDGAVLHPLSSFDPERLRQEHADQRLVFCCRTGNRSAKAAEMFQGGAERTYHLAGGIEGWKAAGLPVTRPESAPAIPVMRQVQIVAGALVVTGVALGQTLSPWFLAIAAFVGCGLMFAGVSGWCGMARLLAFMPWNRGMSERSDAIGTRPTS